MIIVIEGGDQAGKKTQSMLLAKALKKAKLKTKVFSFPDYSTPIGKEIKRFLNKKRKFPPQTTTPRKLPLQQQPCDQLPFCY